MGSYIYGGPHSGVNAFGRYIDPSMVYAVLLSGFGGALFGFVLGTVDDITERKFLKAFGHGAVGFVLGFLGGALGVYLYWWFKPVNGAILALFIALGMGIASLSMRKTIGALIGGVPVGFLGEYLAANLHHYMPETIMLPFVIYWVIKGICIGSGIALGIILSQKQNGGALPIKNRKIIIAFLILVFILGITDIFDTHYKIVSYSASRQETGNSSERYLYRFKVVVKNTGISTLKDFYTGWVFTSGEGALGISDKTITLWATAKFEESFTSDDKSTLYFIVDKSGHFETARKYKVLSPNQTTSNSENN